MSNGDVRSALRALLERWDLSESGRFPFTVGLTDGTVLHVVWPVAVAIELRPSGPPKSPVDRMLEKGVSAEGIEVESFPERGLVRTVTIPFAEIAEIHSLPVEEQDTGLLQRLGPVVAELVGMKPLEAYPPDAFPHERSAFDLLKEDFDQKAAARGLPTVTKKREALYVVVAKPPHPGALTHFGPLSFTHDHVLYFDRDYFELTRHGINGGGFSVPIVGGGLSVGWDRSLLRYVEGRHKKAAVDLGRVCGSDKEEVVVLGVPVFAADVQPTEVFEDGATWSAFAVADPVHDGQIGRRIYALVKQAMGDRMPTDLWVRDFRRFRFVCQIRRVPVVQSIWGRSDCALVVRAIVLLVKDNS